MTIYSYVRAQQRNRFSALVILALCFQTPAIAQNVRADDDVLNCSVQYQELGICEAAQSAFEAINNVTTSPTEAAQNELSQKSPAHNAFNDVENWKSKALFDSLSSDKRQSLYTYNQAAAANAYLLSICSAHPIEKEYELNRLFYDSLLNEFGVQLIMEEFSTAIENDNKHIDKEFDCGQTHSGIVFDWYASAKSSSSTALGDARQNLEYQKWKGSDRVQTARLKYCEKAASDDGENYQEIITTALNEFPAMGPPAELIDRCQFFLFGQLNQLKNSEKN